MARQGRSGGAPLCCECFHIARLQHAADGSLHIDPWRYRHVRHTPFARDEVAGWTGSGASAHSLRPEMSVDEAHDLSERVMRARMRALVILIVTHWAAQQ